MAIYMFATTPMSRKKGRSAVAAAAYRSGSQLTDERTNVVHDYCRKRGVLHTEIVAPQGITPPDREQLWNAAEAAEKRRDARVAREYLVALPHELGDDQRLELARQLARELVERYAVAVDIAIHAPDTGGDQRNFHAHLLATTRCINHGGLSEKSQIKWSDTKRRNAGLGCGGDEIKLLRKRWETLANAAMERAEIAARIDCRTLEEQGIDRVPQVHVGSMGTEQIRRGTPENSDRAMLNLEIIAANCEVQELREQLDVEQACEVWAEISPPPAPSAAVELPSPAPSPASRDELALARESARLDALECVEHHISNRHQLQIRAELRELERVQQRRWERIEEREWHEWTSQPGVCSATGRIVGESRMMNIIEASWWESQRLEAAERAARREEPAAPRSQSLEPPRPGSTISRLAAEARERGNVPTPRSRPQPEAALTLAPQPLEAEPPLPAATAVPLPRERAAAEVRRIFLMREQGERAEAIHEAMLDADDAYVDELQERIIALGIGAHGELSPAAQRFAQRFAQQAQSDEEVWIRDERGRDWRTSGSDGPR